MIELENCTVAVQKEGRLTEASLEWLNAKAGSDFPVEPEPFDRRRELIDTQTGIIALGYSNGDVLKAVACGQADYGIAGEDKIDELTRVEGSRDSYSKMNQFANMERLAIVNTKPWRLSLARSWDAEGPIERVATSYPKTARSWLQRSRFNTSSNPIIDEYAGGVESIARREGYDTIVEIVDTGETLAANEFEEIEVMATCSPWLFRCVREPLTPELFDALKSTSILDVVSRRLQERQVNPTDSEASRLVADGNESRKKLAVETGELIAELAVNGDVALEAADVMYALCAALVQRKVNIRAALIELGGRYNGEALLPLASKGGRLQFVEDDLSRIVQKQTIL